jgi:hypothetical protein
MLTRNTASVRALDMPRETKGRFYQDARRFPRWSIQKVSRFSMRLFLSEPPAEEAQKRKVFRETSRHAAVPPCRRAAVPPCTGTARAPTHHEFDASVFWWSVRQRDVFPLLGDPRASRCAPTSHTRHTRRTRQPTKRQIVGHLRANVYPCFAMPNLRAVLDDLTSSFAESLLQAIRSASLDELLGRADGRGPGKAAAGAPPRRAAAPMPVSVAPKKTPTSGRLPRRSAEEIAKALEGVVALVKKHKDGLRAEQIRVELDLEAKELPLILKEGLATRKLKSKGQKRATTYFA